MEVLYEDNHLIIVNKAIGEIVQGDKTGDRPLVEKVRSYIRDKYNKPGNVFCGLTHRLDRPVSGVVVFAKTSKALPRINKLFQNHDLVKRYWAIVSTCPKVESGHLEHFLVRNEKQNKSYAYDEPHGKDSKKATLNYKVIARSDRYFLLEVELLTGRHHQIRCQLAQIGCPIKGDLKYGAKRSNPNGGISLLARSISFVHPVSQEMMHVIAPPPGDDKLWQILSSKVKTTQVEETPEL